MAIVTYSTDAALAWDFSSPNTENRASLRDAIRNQLPYRSGLTNTGSGLQLARTQVLNGPGNRYEILRFSLFF